MSSVPKKNGNSNIRHQQQLLSILITGSKRNLVNATDRLCEKKLPFFRGHYINNPNNALLSRWNPEISPKNKGGILWFPTKMGPIRWSLFFFNNGLENRIWTSGGRVFTVPKATCGEKRSSGEAWNRKNPWPKNTQGINISHLGKRLIIFKHALGGDMLLARRVKKLDWLVNCQF